MKKLIYNLLMLLLVCASIAVQAQEDEPGDPEERKGACKCYLPLQNLGLVPYGCTNMSSNVVCSGMNTNLESTNYFEGWRGNYGPVCGKNFAEIRRIYDFSTIKKNHDDQFMIMDNTTYAMDPICGFPTRSPLGGNQAVRIGDDIPGAHGEAFTTTIRVERANPKITLLYAFVLSDQCGDPDNEPFFRITVQNKTNSCQTVVSLQFEMTNELSIPDLKYTTHPLLGKFAYKEWTSLVIDFTNFFSNGSVAYEEFSITAVAADCSYCVHTGYGYVDAVCGTKSVIVTPPPIGGNPDPVDPPVDPGDPDPEPPFNGLIKCVGADIAFSLKPNFMDETYLWDFGDGKGWSTERDPTYFFTQPGIYTITSTVSSVIGQNMGLAPVTETFLVKVIDCCELPGAEKIKQENCITAFSPVEGETYILHAWVKEDITDINTDNRIVSYAKSSPHITLTFSNESISPVVINCFPSGPVIDGWQRIEKEFTVPQCPNAKMDLDIALHSLVPNLGEHTYFDDIRIFPKKGGMKSFVYDPVSQKLLAELDEENFATFYEYDQEGALIRVKKETERGIKTIKETGNNSQKITQQ